MADINKQVSESQKKWSQRVDFTSPNDINDYIKFKILKYRHYNFTNDNMWEQYKKDFTDFVEVIFKTYKLVTIYNLQTLFHNQGVWVEKNKQVTIAQSLYNILYKEDQTE
jgi:hypothetical protein